MSAGIIHEINNPLNFTTTGLFTLRHKGQHLAPEQQEEYREVLKDVEEGLQRVKTIVSDLRMFTHPDTESRDQVEVPEVVAAALRFLSNEWKDSVRIEQNLAEHQTVWGNKNKLIHVLVNLQQNSMDSLRQKTFADEGKTEESAREEYRKLSERRVRLGLLIGDIGDKAKIEVTQDGRAVATLRPEKRVYRVQTNPMTEAASHCNALRGVYVSTDRGGTWSLLGPGLPAAAVSDLAIQEREQDLLAGWRR